MNSPRGRCNISKEGRGQHIRRTFQRRTCHTDGRHPTASRSAARDASCIRTSPYTDEALWYASSASCARNTTIDQELHRRGLDSLSWPILWFPRFCAYAWLLTYEKSSTKKRHLAQVGSSTFIVLQSCCRIADSISDKFVQSRAASH